MITLVELFAGLGAPRKALTNLRIEYTSKGYSEINENAIAQYCAIHNDTPDANLGSVTDIKNIDKVDILFHGSPCQDFSTIGVRKGGEEGSNTRSSLLWNSVNIIRSSLPNIVIWENVKAVLYKNNLPVFESYISELDKLGYTSTFKILNSLDYGIPQSRNRVFVVSVLNGSGFKFNFDDMVETVAPPLKDFLDFTHDTVKYKYLSSKHGGTHATLKNEIFDTILSSTEYLPYTTIDHSRKLSNTSFKCYSDAPYMRTLTTGCGNFGIVDEKKFSRAITPYEAYKLMGFDRESYVLAVNSVKNPNSLYMQAGNSIVVNILESLFSAIKYNNKSLVNC